MARIRLGLGLRLAMSCPGVVWCGVRIGIRVNVRARVRVNVPGQGQGQGSGSRSGVKIRVGIRVRVRVVRRGVVSCFLLSCLTLVLTPNCSPIPNPHLVVRE